MHDIRYPHRVRISDLFLLGGLIPLVTSQTLSNSSSLPEIYPCNQSLATANASGLYSYSPDLPNANATGDLPPFKLAVTVAQPPGRNAIFYNVWGDPNGADFADEAASGFDVCSFGLFGLTNNTQYRGQTDDGDCLATFDQSCVNAMTGAAETLATSMIRPNQQPAANLTGNLTAVCNQIGDQLTSFVQSAPECSNYLFPNATMNNVIIPLTGLSHYQSLYNETCTLTDGQDEYNHIFGVVGSYTPATVDLVYNFTVQWVQPLMLLYMPPVNATLQAQRTITNAVAGLTCLRTNNIAPGSLVPPPLPSPTPVGQSNKLSGGAIAGIVVGVIIFVLLLLAGTLLYIFLRRKRRRTLDQAAEGHAAPPGDMAPPVMTERYEKRLLSAPLSELSEDSARKPELDGVPTSELDAVNSMERAELDGRHPLLELPATPLEGGEKK